MSFPPPLLPNQKGFNAKELPHMLFPATPPGLPNFLSMPPPPLPPGLGFGLLPTPINKPEQAVTQERNLLNGTLVLCKITENLGEFTIATPRLEQDTTVMPEENNELIFKKPGEANCSNTAQTRLQSPPPGVFLPHKRELEYSRLELRMIENNMHNAGWLSELPKSAKCGFIIYEGIHATYIPDIRGPNNRKGRRARKTMNKNRALNGPKNLGDSTSTWKSGQPSSSKHQGTPYHKDDNGNRSRLESEPILYYKHDTYHREIPREPAEVTMACIEYTENHSCRKTDNASSSYGTPAGLRSRERSYEEDQSELKTDQLFSQISDKLAEPIAPPPGLEQIKMIVHGLIEEKTEANAPEPTKTLQVNAETKRIITSPPGLFLHPKKPEPATSRFSPSPDVSLDQRSRFAIRNYFCRGLPWTVERRKGTPLEGLSEDEINHLFRKLFIEGCEGVTSTPIASKSRFHDKPTSQIEYQNTIKSGRKDNYHEEENRNHGYDRNGSDRYYGESRNQDYYDDRERRNSTNYDYEDRYRSNQSGSQYDRSNFHDRRTNYNASPRCNEDYEFGSKLFQRHNNRNS